MRYHAGSAITRTIKLKKALILQTGIDEAAGLNSVLVAGLGLQHELAEHLSVGQGLQRGGCLRERITLWRWRFQAQ